MAATFLCTLAAVLLALSAIQCEGALTPEKAMDAFDTKLKEHVKECKEELQVDMETCHEQFLKSPENIPESCKCLAACVGKKAGVVDKAGMILPDQLKKKMEDIKDERIKKCGKKLYEDCKDAPKGEGGCSDSNNLVICFALHFKAHKEECRLD